LGQLVVRMISPLQQPDTMHLQAAQGWFELGNHVEADGELEQISPQNHAHPAVLEMRWMICAAAKKWEAALDITATFIQLAPEHPFGWIHRSFALHELNRTAEARDNLLSVLDKFPDDSVLRYNVACYECLLGRLEQAKHWLENAFKMGNPKRMKFAALRDSDLKPLWKEIGTL
jgi:tetratricopeptide (TPR) repeat protein